MRKNKPVTPAQRHKLRLIKARKPHITIYNRMLREGLIGARKEK